MWILDRFQFQEALSSSCRAQELSVVVRADETPSIGDICRLVSQPLNPSENRLFRLCIPPHVVCTLMQEVNIVWLLVWKHKELCHMSVVNSAERSMKTAAASSCWSSLSDSRQSWFCTCDIITAANFTSAFSRPGFAFDNGLQHTEFTRKEVLQLGHLNVVAEHHLLSPYIRPENR